MDKISENSNEIDEFDDSENLEVIIARGHGGNQLETVVLVSDISCPTWDNVSGGYHRRQSGYSLWGYVSYDEYEDKVNCSGRHSGHDNDMKVLICRAERSSPYYKGYKLLADAAGPKPKSDISLNRPKGEPPCTQKIIFILKDGPMKRGDLRKKIYDTGYRKTTFASAINRLRKQEKIICEGSPCSPNQIIRLTKMDTSISS